MKFPMTAIALGLAAMSLAAPASATSFAPEQEEVKQEREWDLSKKVRKSVIELQEAISYGDWAKVAELDAAVASEVKTDDDHIILAQMRTNAALKQDNLAGSIQHIETMAQYGEDISQYLPVFTELGRQLILDDKHAEAMPYLERARAIDSSDVNSLVLLAEAHAETGNAPKGIELLAAAIREREAQQQTVDENWYKRAVELAYNAKSSAAYQLSRNWIRAYPTTEAWKDALGIYLYMENRPVKDLLDVMRLQAATNSFNGRADYLLFAEELIAAGFPGEALTVLDAGVAANVLDANQQSLKEVMDIARQQSSSEKGSLDADAKSAMAAASGRRSISMGDAFYGYGDYGRAAELYANALTKSDVDDNTANLRLGMALARSGDHAGAKEALAKVTGAYSETAAYWMLWADLQS